MTSESESDHPFRGAAFEGADFRGATFRDCDLREVKVTDSWLTDVDMSGHVERFFVNDVDVTDFVNGELDRRHPERIQLRKMESADDYRAMWATIERMWAATTERARRLPEPAWYERVGGEWSFVETLRHLIFATDAWAISAIRDEEGSFHRLGLPHAPYPRHVAIDLGIALDIEPSFDEVLGARLERMAVVDALVTDLTDAGLTERRTRPPAPGYPDEVRTVGHCLRVVMNEECEHHRYAVRDLLRLENPS